VHNKFVEKGNLVEEDALDLLSEIDGVTYFKNDEHLENDWVRGTPDNRQDGTVIDTKSNYDLDTFDKAELTKLYEYQIKTYLFLDNKKHGILAYCLVNTPLHRIEAERKSLWYAMGMPEEDNNDWLETVCQLERNMIFDIP